MAVKEKKKSIKSEVIRLVTLTAVIICLLVTVAGSVMIYVSTENSIKNEVEHAAITMENFYDKKHEGEYYIKQGSLYKGKDFLSNEEFRGTIGEIFFGDDVYFTLIWGDTLMFTSIKNKDGSFAVGSKVSDNVVEHVLNRGEKYLVDNININGEKYVACYIPLVQNDEVVGMFFAGKPTKIARQNMTLMIALFIVISAVVMLASIFVCNKFTGDLVSSLLDIRNFMEKIAGCFFDVKLAPKSIKREDEIGDIARSAEILKGNLRDLIERDPLTSLLNRRSGRMIIETIKEDGKTYIAAMGDIDFFKKVNDTYGHACGDLVLKKVSSIINERMGKSGGYAIRWGGEEFLMIFPSTSMDQAMSALDKIMNKVRGANIEWEGKPVPVTMTIGVSQSKEKEKIDDAIGRADEHLYEGKNGGRNRIVS